MTPLSTLSRRGLVGLSISLAFYRPALAAADLPVFHPHDVILFQGDSITEGGRQAGLDYNHNMGQDYDYILAAELGLRLADRDLTFLNRGISGNTVTDLAARWRDDVLALKPNLLSILIGVNDTLFASESVPTYETTYDQLLTDTRAALPQIKIVMGQPFVLPVGRQIADYDQHRAAVKLRQDAAARLASKHGWPLIPYQQVFDDAQRLAPADHWSWDGVHPTYAGHGLMSQAWLKTVTTTWPDG